MFILLFCLLGTFCSINSLDNGLALTPPMGWLHWEQFHCEVDCENNPDTCISEKLFQQMADRLAEDGYLGAGYQYIIIDDCWLASERDSEGRLQADPDRFPSGIKALADYVHDKGLKFGIYEDYGTKTCAGYPGSLDHLEIDANTFAEWGVDYLKFDGCNVEANEAMELGHLEMASYLNKTGRPIVFSCEFPLYVGTNTNYTIAVEACNLWRNYRDIRATWDVINGAIQFYKDNLDTFMSVAGPGHWNDPDMILVGMSGMNYELSKVQMTVWSIWSAPLIMSNDLRDIDEQSKSILLNKHAILINQDPLGMMGHLHTTIDETLDVWMKHISPKVGDEFSCALGFVNNGEDVYTWEFTLESLNLNNAAGYMLMDVFGEAEDVVVQITDTLEVTVNPQGAEMWHLMALEEQNQ